MIVCEWNLIPFVLNLGCEYVELRATGEINGIYKMEDYLEDGRFVFKHLDRDLFIYRLSNGHWVVIIIL